MDPEWNAELGEEAQHDRYRKEHRGERKVRAQAIGGEHIRRKIDDERPGRHAEHRERQRDERKVVQHRHAEDPGQQDFVHQRGERDEEEADVSRGSRFGVRGSGFGVRRSAFGVRGAVLKSRFFAQAVP